jgi:hypothetical protein
MERGGEGRGRGGGRGEGEGRGRGERERENYGIPVFDVNWVVFEIWLEFCSLRDKKKFSL